MILLAGCSFVDNPDLPRIMFGDRAYGKRSVVKHVGLGGAGNHYIARAVMDNLTDDVTGAVVLFSGTSRIDIEIPEEMVDDVLPFYQDKKMGAPVVRSPRTVWFNSGGYGGYWNNYTRTKYAKYIHQYLKSQYLPLDWEYLNHKSLIDIAGCLNTLEAKGIDYRFGFIYNIFEDHTHEQTSLGGAVARDNPLLNLINWDKALSSYPYNYCLHNGLLSSDDFHPSHEGYQSWWNSVKDEVPFVHYYEN